MSAEASSAEYAWWPDAGEVVAVLRRVELWGELSAEVAVPATGTFRRVPSSALAPLSERRWQPAEVAMRAAEGRILHELSLGHPSALGRGRLVPLPHQLAVLDRALATDPVRLLLADEVGLGKTIEAGLIISELKARTKVRRVVIVAPKGVQLQWVTELADRFGEEFVLVGPGGVPVDAGINPWRAFDQVVCSLDSVKPLRARAGWPPEQVADHNERRFRGLVDAGWDLVVIDEAHHVSGSNDEIARHRLGRELAGSCPRLLLLSATPHSGKSESFARLLGLLDDRFLNGAPLTRAEVAPLVVRTAKRDALDQDGRPLFRPRLTRLETVSYGARTVEQALYEAVTDYVRHGYRRSLAEHRPSVGFLVLLMQRLVSSSTAAILQALERRLLAVSSEGTQLNLFGSSAEEWGDLDGEEQVAALHSAQGRAWDQERAEVELLADVARKAAAGGVDAKAHHLLDLLRRIGRAEGDPYVKAVVFTEFVSTQGMLLDLLAGAGVTAVGINGSLSIAERRLAQEVFEKEARVLVSTDAGGEGINLQFAHVVINYDLPWSPMRIEQRIGRVDRIGQAHNVAAFNLVLESSVDARVLEVLEAKLAIILAELGVDKQGDVLASAARHVENLYAVAIMDPGSLSETAVTLEAQTRDDLAATEPLRALMPTLRPDIRPVVGEVNRWHEIANRARSAMGMAALERERAATGTREIVPGEPVPLVAGEPAGWWSLWEIATNGPQGSRDCFALFLTDAGAVRPDLAEHHWQSLPLGSEVRTGPAMDAASWQRLQGAGADHAYRVLHAMTQGGPAAVPWLALRLAVRVEP